MNQIHFAGAGVEAPGSGQPILHPTNLHLSEHRIGVIGANGSGKSTLARMINGLVTASTGRVTIDGSDPAKHGAKVRRKVGFVFTQPNAQLVMPTVIEDVMLSLRHHVRSRPQRENAAMRVLQRFGLHEHAHTSVHSLSGGQQQMLALAGVLAVEPEIIVADEPTTLLDLRNSEMICKTLLNLNQQLILITHDLDLAAECERVILIEDGAVRHDGPADEAIALYRQLSSYPGLEL